MTIPFSRNLLVPLGLIVVAVAARAQVPDSAKGRRPPLLSVHALTASSRRQVASEGSPVREVTRSLRGGELEARDPSGAGIGARYLAGDFPGQLTAPEAGRVEHVDAWVVLGIDFAVEIGYAGRTFFLDEKKRQLHMPRAGARVEIPLRGTGITLLSRAGYIRSVGGQKKDSLLYWAIEGEAAVRYTPPYFPVSVEIGFRQDSPRIEREGMPIRREQLSSLVLGIGLAALRR